MANPENKQIPYESTQKDIRDAIESVATAIGGIAIPSADHVSYDNSGSGLSATDVQNAIDEIVSDIPTVNNGTLTIQQNGTSIGSFSANTASNVTANIKTPTADKKTATDQFDTADGGLLSKCQINLVPNQDLHGYDNPWVGGAGKNKLPLVLADIKSANTSGTWNGNIYTINGGTFKVLTDNANNVIGINVNGTFNATTTLVIIPNTSDNNFVGEILNCDGVVNESQSISLQYFNGTTYVNFYILKNSTDNYTITNAGNKVQIMVRIASGQTVNNIVFKPMIRLATETDPTFAPYSNVRPISGHTEVDLQTAGKNLLRVTASSTTPYTVNDDGTILANGTSYGINLIIGYVYPNGSTQYKLNGCPSGGGDSTYRLDARLVSTNALISGSEDKGSGSTFTASEPFYIALRSPNAVVMSNVLFKPMVRFATETDSTFEPYLGHLYTVQIGSTVYGGYVDLVSGVMNVEYGFITCDGSSDEEWYPTSNDRMFLNNFDSNTDASLPLANWLKGTTDVASQNVNGIYITNTHLLVCRLENKSVDANTWRTYLGNNPLTVCYELDTPQTIQLTPQQIETLAGQNHLSTPFDGQSIETNGVEYKELFTFADVKSYVDKKIPDAPTTDGTYTLQAVVSGGVPTYSWV